MRRFFKPVCLVAVVLAASAFFLGSVRRLDDGRAGQSRDQLERALRRSVTISYATYGAYPESLDDIVERYGIRIDGDRFAVFYTPVAENLPPELVILDIGQEGGGAP